LLEIRLAQNAEAVRFDRSIERFVLFFPVNGMLHAI
jgi:hypothetical protein